MAGSYMSERKERKIGRRGVVIALGIIGIISVACLGGVIVAYTLIINDKNNAISLLNSQISQLTSNVTSLKNQLDSILNGSTTPLEIIIGNLPAWLNQTVVVEGNLTGPVGSIPEKPMAWNYDLISRATYMGVSWNTSVWYVSVPVRVYGVVTEKTVHIFNKMPPYGTLYYIEAEKVEPLCRT
jgi:hypothetical protein